MNITVTINSVDRTSDINWRRFSILDAIADRVNSCSFSIKGGTVPEVGQTIEVTDGADTLFAGTILKVRRTIEGELLENYHVEAVDYTNNLNRSLVVEKYESQTVNDIIDDLITEYHPDFTTNNVDCDTTLTTINLNNISVMKAIQKMAKTLNFYWYVDYDKDIHFFAKNDNLSPFNLTDTNGNYIYKSLAINDDLSQLRNVVKIRGGDYVGSSRTETFNGDGTKDQFALANKFSSKPTVTIGGSPQTVGLEYIDDEADYDCFWSFQEKYIRFKTEPTTGTNNISITGTPLIPIMIQIREEESIDQYGEYYFYKKDKTIDSRDEAREYADSELAAYRDSVVEGSFRTYESGLRTGQVINIQSTKRSLDQDFLIQNVRMKMISPDAAIYRVKLATTKTVGIIDFLRGLILNQDKIQVDENENLQKYYNVYKDLDIEEVITNETASEVFENIELEELIRRDPFTPVWVLGDYFPTNDSDPKRNGRLGISMYLY